MFCKGWMVVIELLAIKKVLERIVGWNSVDVIAHLSSSCALNLFKLVPSKSLDPVVMLIVLLLGHYHLLVVLLQCFRKVRKIFTKMAVNLFDWYQSQHHHRDQENKEHYETSEVRLLNAHVLEDLADGMP